MELRELKAFCLVVEEGSFSKAALRLNLVQPTVSLQIKALEDELGVKLLCRMNRKIILTEQGEILYGSAQRMLKILEEIQAKISASSGSVRGELRVGTGVTVGESIMPILLGSFKEIYPEVRITLSIIDTKAIVRQILDYTLDIGVVGAEVKHRDLVLEKFMEEDLILIVPPSHRWKKSKGITLAQLKEEPFLAREEGSGTRMTIKRRLEEMGCREADLKIVMDLGSNGAIKIGVMNGIGVSMVNRDAVKNELKMGLLKEVPIKDFSLFPLSKSFYLVYHPRKAGLQPLTTFLQFLKKKISPPGH